MNKKYLNFKLFLIKNDIQEKEIADLLNVNSKTVSKKINGKNDFKVKEVITICKKYNVSSDIFI